MTDKNDNSSVSMCQAALHERAAKPTKKHKSANRPEQKCPFHVCRLSDIARERHEMSVEHFQRFAAECEAMADGTRNPKDKELWMRLAQRWLKCAALMEQDEADLRARRRKDRATIH
jgi:hypothetical protein